LARVHTVTSQSWTASGGYVGGCSGCNKQFVTIMVE
jgi:hypothetical protein